MDSELRRRFLQILGQDFAAIDLNEAGVSAMGRRFELNGQRRWPEVRAWWLSWAEERTGDGD